MIMGNNEVRTFLQDLMTELNSEELRPGIENFIGKVATIFADKFASSVQPSQAVKIDVKSFVQELASGSLNADLQQFFTWNHRFVALLSEKNRRAAVETYDFVDSVMPFAIFNPNQMAVISSKKEEIISANGHILELGVYKGGSTRALAGIFPDQIIHGFDSFEGLPDDWSHTLKGAFGDVKGILPNMPKNVILYKGWFENTLPIWFEDNKFKQISLLRIDCDIYSSTKTIFTVLKPIIKSGTWIVFDELIGYYGWKAHEYKAFMEFVAETGIEFEYIAFGLTYVMGYIK
jgi:hypothetical protein